MQLHMRIDKHIRVYNVCNPQLYINFIKTLYLLVMLLKDNEKFSGNTLYLTRCKIFISVIDSSLETGDFFSQMMHFVDIQINTLLYIICSSKFKIYPVLKFRVRRSNSKSIFFTNFLLKYFKQNI